MLLSIENSIFVEKVMLKSDELKRKMGLLVSQRSIVFLYFQNQKFSNFKFYS